MTLRDAAVLSDADRAREAIRDHDRHTPVIDVSIVIEEPPID